MVAAAQLHSLITVDFPIAAASAITVVVVVVAA